MNRIHPAITAFGQAVQRAGWRVTSIIRPGSESHWAGLAIDVCPWQYANRGWGWRTAAMLLKLAVKAAPNTRFVVVSEGDHAHVEVIQPGDWSTTFNFPHGVGVKDSRGVRIRRAFVNIKGNVLLDGSESLTLPAAPIGDPIGEYGDFGGAEAGDPEETGDIDPMGDPFEIGAPSRSKRVAPRNAPARAKALGRVAAGANSADPAVRQRAAAQARMLQRTNPAAAAELRAVAAIRQAVARTTPPFVFIKNGVSLISSTLGPNARLRDADATTAVAEIMSAEPFDPQVFAFANSGANMVIDVDAALCTANGGPLAIGVTYKWVGTIIDISTSVLNKEPAKAFSISVTTATGEVQSATFRNEKGVDAVSFVLFNGKLSGGAPRLLSRLVTAAAVATGLKRITVTGLDNTRYTSAARMLVPGDKEVESLLSMLAGI